MNPGNLVFTITILALGVANYYAARSYFRARKATAAARAELHRQETAKAALADLKREEIATAIRNARRAGYLQGCDHAMSIWGAHARTINQMHVHGFAEACRKCGLVTLNLISASEEYWSCHQCQHRNPAPLPRHLQARETAAETPDPAKHDDP